MNLNELKKDHPDLYEEIFNLGVASVDVKALKKDAHKEGVEQERTRVTEILAADADFTATTEAITGGIDSKDSYKMFYEAEKAKGEKALENLKANAPESVGAEIIDEEGVTLQDPDTELTQKAKKLAQEKNINIAEAIHQVSRENPELTQRMLPANPLH